RAVPDDDLSTLKGDEEPRVARVRERDRLREAGGDGGEADVLRERAAGEEGKDEDDALHGCWACMQRDRHGPPLEVSGCGGIENYETERRRSSRKDRPCGGQRERARRARHRRPRPAGRGRRSARRRPDRRRRGPRSPQGGRGTARPRQQDQQVVLWCATTSASSRTHGLRYGCTSMSGSSVVPPTVTSYLMVSLAPVLLGQGRAVANQWLPVPVALIVDPLRVIVKLCVQLHLTVSTFLAGLTLFGTQLRLGERLI